MVKVVINALSARLGGGQTYLINLLRYIPVDEKLDIFILGPSSLRASVEPTHLRWLSPSWPVDNPLMRTLWERFRFPAILRELGTDVLFCPGGVVVTPAPKGCKVVTMFRNMIPFDRVQRMRYPLGYMRVRNWLLERSMLRSMVRADLVIFVSQFAKQVIERRAPGQIKRSAVIPHGVGSEFRLTDAPGPRPSWLPKEDYLLYVSSFDVYKAQVQVVREFALLKQRRLGQEKLILVGSDSQNPQYAQAVRSEIHNLGLEGEVIIPGLIPYLQLPALYRHAAVNIFATESENCPNILLEAMAAGRPVVCSSLPPMPEFGGDAVSYFNPRTPSDLATKVWQVLDDPAFGRSLGKRAATRVANYNWEAAASSTWRILQSFASKECQLE
jgi:glycosyltransferase involved in cell wall biosynthesis